MSRKGEAVPVLNEVPRYNDVRILNLGIWWK